MLNRFLPHQKLLSVDAYDFFVVEESRVDVASAVP